MVGKISCKQDNLVLDACFLVLCQKYLNASYIFITAVLRKKPLCSVYMVSSSAVIL